MIFAIIVLISFLHATSSLTSLTVLINQSIFTSIPVCLLAPDVVTAVPVEVVNEYILHLVDPVDPNLSLLPPAAGVFFTSVFSLSPMISLNGPVVAYRRYYCVKDKSYIIIGGLGGFGLDLTDWLILRGARNIVLISRTGIKNGYQRVKVRLWESYNVNVQIVKNIDVSDPKDCQHLLKSVERQAPVDAIFNLGVVLKNGILKNQTTETFMESFRSKAWATQTLDKLSRKICPKLRHFVVFSSVSCGRGNAGQTNYGMANSIMERICEKRVQEGLTGLAIQWGAIGDVGLVADMQEDNKELIIGGTLQQKISCCLDELDKFLVQSRPIVSSMVVAEKKTGFSGFNDLVETVANILGSLCIRIYSFYVYNFIFI
ncbi:hypothetical protein P5V15_011509 [Pogonomyrmex californicus]